MNFWPLSFSVPISFFLFLTLLCNVPLLGMRTVLSCEQEDLARCQQEMGRQRMLLLLRLLQRSEAKALRKTAAWAAAGPVPAVLQRIRGSGCRLLEQARKMP